MDENFMKEIEVMGYAALKAAYHSAVIEDDELGNPVLRPDAEKPSYSPDSRRLSRKIANIIRKANRTSTVRRNNFSKGNSTMEKDLLVVISSTVVGVMIIGAVLSYWGML